MSLSYDNWPVFYLEMMPHLVARWPEVQGEFRLIPTEGPNCTLWDEKTGRVEVHLRADATENVKTHEIGHVAAIRMFPALSKKASYAQHELAAHLIEMHLLGRTGEWERRVDLQEKQIALMIRRCALTLAPSSCLGEIVHRALGGR